MFVPVSAPKKASEFFRSMSYPHTCMQEVMQQACIPQFQSALATAPASGAELETCLHGSLQVGPGDHSAPFCSIIKHLVCGTRIGLHNCRIYDVFAHYCCNLSFLMQESAAHCGRSIPASFLRRRKESAACNQGLSDEQGLSRVLQQHEQLLCLLRAQLLHKGQGPGSAAHCHSSSVTGICMRYQQAVSAMVQDAAPVQLTGDHFFISVIMSQQLSCRRDGTSASLSYAALILRDSKCVLLLISLGLCQL